MTDKQNTTSSHYLYNGNTVTPMAAANLITTRRLATGTYEVCYNQDKGFYLNKIDDMLVPGNVYGDTPQFADRVVKTFIDRGCNTGVLLEGEQGSGKTMLAKLVSSLLREIDMPTIVINTAYTGPAFNSFMAAIDTPCMVFFDEFEKTYSKQEDKEKILTFFDGVFDSNKLIICTVNDKSRMSTHMLNRPGRLYYSMSYNRLSLEVIEEYCNQALEDKSMIPSIKKVTTLYGGFNFDMLKALVEEMNRYKCAPKEALKFLNIRPSFTKFRTGTVYVPVGWNEATKKGVVVEKASNPPSEDSGESLRIAEFGEKSSAAVNSLINSVAPNRDDMIMLLACSIIANKDPSNRYGDRIYVTHDDLLAYDGDSGVQTYETGDFSIKYIPYKDSEFKEMVEEARVLAAAMESEMPKAESPFQSRQLPKIN